MLQSFPEGWGSPGYLQLPQDRVVLNAREQHPHGVGAVVQVGDPRAVQVAGQLVDVRLQLCKGCSGEERTGHGELSLERLWEKVLGRAGCPVGSSGEDSEELRHPWRLLSAAEGGRAGAAQSRD